MVKTKNELSFEELIDSYTEHQAVSESSRCLMCDDAPCQAGCPANVRVADFLRKIRYGDFIGAAQIIREDNVFGASCARICPTSRLCQEKCSNTKLDTPIDIPGLQKFVCDMQIKTGLKAEKAPELLNKKVAVIGAGPGGLAAGFELRKLGYDVTIYEAQSYAGGLLKAGIPTYRLPRETLQAEIDFIVAYGVKIVFNHRVENISELKKNYDAVYISMGMEDEKIMDIPGIDLPGVYTALEFLGQKYIDNNLKLGQRVAVIGGGDVAMDCARTAVRVDGVKDVYVIYRRSATEMPAQEEEISGAKEEGIIIQNLLIPFSIEGQGKVEKLLCNQIELGDPDESGRRRPIALKETQVEFKVDNVIFAIGQEARKAFFDKNPELKVTRKVLLEVNPETFETSLPGIFAGGDIVGSTTAVEAIGCAKIAVQAMHEKLSRGN